MARPALFELEVLRTNRDAEMKRCVCIDPPTSLSEPSVKLCDGRVKAVVAEPTVMGVAAVPRDSCDSRRALMFASVGEIGCAAGPRDGVGGCGCCCGGAGGGGGGATSRVGSDVAAGGASVAAALASGCCCHSGNARTAGEGDRSAADLGVLSVVCAVVSSEKGTLLSGVKASSRSSIAAASLRDGKLLLREIGVGAVDAAKLRRSRRGSASDATDALRERLTDGSAALGAAAVAVAEVVESEKASDVLNRRGCSCCSSCCCCCSPHAAAVALELGCGSGLPPGVEPRPRSGEMRVFDEAVDAATEQEREARGWAEAARGAACTVAYGRFVVLLLLPPAAGISIVTLAMRAVGIEERVELARGPSAPREYEDDVSNPDPDMCASARAPPAYAVATDASASSGLPTSRSDVNVSGVVPSLGGVIVTVVTVSGEADLFACAAVTTAVAPAGTGSVAPNRVGGTASAHKSSFSAELCLCVAARSGGDVSEARCALMGEEPAVVAVTFPHDAAAAAGGTRYGSTVFPAAAANSAGLAVTMEGVFSGTSSSPSSTSSRGAVRRCCRSPDASLDAAASVAAAEAPQEERASAKGDSMPRWAAAEPPPASAVVVAINAGCSGVVWAKGAQSRLRRLFERGSISCRPKESSLAALSRFSRTSTPRSTPGGATGDITDADDRFALLWSDVGSLLPWCASLVGREACEGWPAAAHTAAHSASSSSSTPTMSSAWRVCGARYWAAAPPVTSAVV